jgi:glycosyltransferase involved in cell wall biosynthesis
MTTLTIGMPVFNDRDFIEQSINSLLEQTFKDYLLIISDDGSTDGSGDICKEFARKDSRIHYIRQKFNLGISGNMQYLLSLAETEFYMWAGDDDLYDSNFIKNHIDELKLSPDAVSAFGGCVIINERGEKIGDPVFINYGNPDKITRLKNYIRNSTDYFGYGVFRTKAIKDVEFPVWWWPNKKTPYNNIYPTLCYYLAKGDFKLIDGNILFYKRVKSESKVNHIIPGKNNAFYETMAFIIRKLNLVLFSHKMIIKAGNRKLALRLFHLLFYYWFLLPSYHQVKLAANSFLRNTILKKNQD